MPLDLVLTVVALLAAGTPLGWAAARLVAARQASPPPSPPPNPLAAGLEAAATPQLLEHRHVIELTPETVQQIGQMLSKVLRAHHRATLMPVAPAQQVVSAPDPEDRIAADMTAGIERGTRALMAAAAERGVTLPPAVARRQAAQMLFAAYAPDAQADPSSPGLF